jgi:hypothetical protein
MQIMNRKFHVMRIAGVAAISVLTSIIGLISFSGVVVATPDPTHLTAEVLAGGQISLHWNDNSSDETGFYIERATSNIDEVFVSERISFTVPANTITFTDNTVASQTTYYFRVSALGDTGNSSPSNTVTATTPPVLKFPKPPMDLSGKAVIASQVSLTWKDQSDNEDGFRVERAADSLFTTELKNYEVKVGEVSFNDSMVEGQRTYYYRVIAWNAEGDSPPSNRVSITTLAAVPEVPTDLVVEFIGDRQVNLRWVDNSETEAGFQVERATDAGFEHDLAIFKVEANFASKVSIKVTDHQTPAGLFFYRVKAYNDSGDSGFSKVSELTVRDYPTQDKLLFGNDTAVLTFPGFTLLSPASVSINRFSQSQEGSITLFSEDDKARLQIPAGTKMSNVNGNPLMGINYFVPDILPQIPENKTIIEAFNFGPNGATFSNKATLTLKYDPADFPRDVTYDDLSVVCWNGSDWQEMDDLKFKPEENTVTVSLIHAGLVAIIGPQPDLSPKFMISNFYVLPQSAPVGDTVYVSLTVTNIGYSFGYNDIVFKLNGAVEDTKQVSLKAGEKTDVQFICADKPVGDYKFDINGTRGSFSILETAVNGPTLTPTTTIPSTVPTFSPVTVSEEPAQFPFLVIIMAAALVIILIVVFVLLRR